MKKYNKLEITGFALLLIGGLSFLSEKFFVVESLISIYSFGRIILYLGLAIWAFGVMKKEKAKKNQK